jgi:hypothetical protein
LAGFCDLVDGLQTPEFAKSEAIVPKVSGCHREYSRFRETDGGDRVRSPLGGAGRSRIRHFLCDLGEEISRCRSTRAWQFGCFSRHHHAPTLRLTTLLECRIVGVPNGASAIVANTAQLIERIVSADSHGQIRIGQKHPTKRDRVRFPVCYQVRGPLRGNAGINDQGTAVVGSHHIQQVGKVRFTSPCVGIGDVHIGDVEAAVWTGLAALPSAAASVLGVL